MSYQEIINTQRFCKEAAVDAIKLEGGVKVASRIRAIADSGICVFGHIGLTPQSAGVMGGFKAQGKNISNARKIIDDAIAVESAGAMFLLVEGVPAQVMAIIRKVVGIPVYGIGAGPDCDGQVLVLGDALGLVEGSFTPKFAKRYAEVGTLMKKGIEDFIDEVNHNEFPTTANCYKAQASDKEFNELLEEYQTKR